MNKTKIDFIFFHEKPFVRSNSDQLTLDADLGTLSKLNKLKTSTLFQKIKDFGEHEVLSGISDERKIRQLLISIILEHEMPETDCFLTIGPAVGMINIQFNSKCLVESNFSYRNIYLPNRIKLFSFFSKYTKTSINVCSEEFILNTGIFFHKNNNNLDEYIKKEYINIIHKLPNYTFDKEPRYEINYQQPLSYYIHFKDIASQIYKFHISINPEYTNQLLNTLFLFRNKHSEVFNKLINKCKIQIPQPQHLYRNITEWSVWKQFINEYNGGIGYFVIYPPVSSTDELIDNLHIFKDWWIENFDKKYPEAARDNHYIAFNERITNTLFIANGSDTKTRENARLSPERYSVSSGDEYEFKESPYIDNQIKEYCRNNDSDLAKCLKYKYGLEDINCEIRNCLEKNGIEYYTDEDGNRTTCSLTWPHDKVWNIKRLKLIYRDDWDDKSDSDFDFKFDTCLDDDNTSDEEELSSDEVQEVSSDEVQEVSSDEVEEELKRIRAEINKLKQKKFVDKRVSYHDKHDERDEELKQIYANIEKIKQNLI